MKSAVRVPVAIVVCAAMALSGCGSKQDEAAPPVDTTLAPSTTVTTAVTGPVRYQECAQLAADAYEAQVNNDFARTVTLGAQLGRRCRGVIDDLRNNAERLNAFGQEVRDKLPPGLEDRFLREMESGELERLLTDRVGG